jgi:glutamate formiminotransferase/formiminotetrahydrofolate cyclodeaminase
MVANLTVGKKGYEAAWDSSSKLAERSQALKAALLRAVDDDTKAFDDVLAAMRLPKATDDEKQARADAIAAAYEKATAVPLATARLCLQAIELAQEAAIIGNKNSISDAGVAALLAKAGLESAILNVRINLPSVREGAFKTATLKESPTSSRSPPGRSRELSRPSTPASKADCYCSPARATRRRDTPRSLRRSDIRSLGGPVTARARAGP